MCSRLGAITFEGTQAAAAAAVRLGSKYSHTSICQPESESVARGPGGGAGPGVTAPGRAYAVTGHAAVSSYRNWHWHSDSESGGESDHALRPRSRSGGG